MKPQEARDLTPDEIERKLKDTKENLFKLRIKLATK
jgi:ribosomal protein L29